jgi:hypothetical protein
MRWYDEEMDDLFSFVQIDIVGANPYPRRRSGWSASGEENVPLFRSATSI